MREGYGDLSVQVSTAGYRGSEYSGYEGDSVGRSEGSVGDMLEKAVRQRDEKVDSCASGMLGNIGNNIGNSIRQISKGGGKW